MQPVFNVSEGVGPDADPTLVWEAIVARAIEARVSDIHVLGRRDGAELAFRLDMLSQGMMDDAFARRLISHVKTMAAIDLGESRRPTEGRMRIDSAERSVDLRVSAVPTIHGQDMVVRLFDRTISLLELGELGLLDDQLDVIEDMIQRPHGPRAQDHHHRKPRRVRPRRGQPDADQPEGRGELLHDAHRDPPPGPRHHHGR